MGRMILLGALGVLLGVGPAQAGELVIRAPFVFVRVAGPGAPGPRVHVEAPFTRVMVPGRSPILTPVQMPPRETTPPVETLPAPKESAPSGVIVEPPAAPPSELVRVPTHKEFARAFKPAAGNYEVVLLHPDTRCPVRVCFSLPPGCPKCVRAERHELEFDYGKYEVEIRFKRDGRVSVEYND